MTTSETKFQSRISSGAPLLSVEIAPPKGGDPAPVRAAAKRYAGKVHAIGVSDSRNGLCMSALAASALLAAEGVEPILHVVTRDRNRLALIGQCLGAQALGVRNILCTSGTHQTLGVCPPAKNVYDIDSIQLLDAIAHLGKNGSTALGEHVEAGPFCVGAVASPFADPQELQLMRVGKKVNAGAAFLITQPVYDPDRFAAWLDRVVQRGLHEKAAILAGIQPLLSAEEAQAAAAGRPSPRIPAALLDRVSAASGAAAQRAAGIEIAVETIKRVSALTGVRGFQISAEGGDDAALEIIQRSGLEAR